MVGNIFFGKSFPALIQSPINCGAFVMLAGIVIVPLVSLFTKAPDKALVDHAFACYDQLVSVPVKESLGQGVEEDTIPS
jgi:hypothetical protein